MLAPSDVTAVYTATSPTWTDERIERLKQLWADGLSGLQISKALGGLTRCAVLGKVHRLELPARKIAAEAKPGDKPLRVKARYNMPRFTIVGVAPCGPNQTRDNSTFAADADIPLAQRKTLMELTPRSCRWPVGDPRHPDFYYCGGTARDDLSPYCAGHMRRAYQRVRR